MNRLERLQARLDAGTGPPDAQGCQRWLGGHDGWGRPVVRVGARCLRVHRVLVELAVGMAPGDLPPLWLACHTCGHHWCVAVDHLYLGDHRTNAADYYRHQAQQP